MSDPKAKAADVAATVRARAVEYASHIPPAQRDRLAAWAGAPAAGPRDDPAAVCVAAAATSEGTRKILAAIERDARDALLYALCGTDVVDLAQFENQVRDFFGWPKARTRAAVDALFAAGLLARGASSSYVVDAFPAVRLGLGPDLLVWLTGATEDAATVMPFVRRLALLVAYAHAEPIALTAQGSMTVRWTERLQDVFAATGFPTHFLGGCVALLGRTGAMGPDPSDADGKAWRVEARADATLASASADLAVTLADMMQTAVWGTMFGTLVLLERARVAGEESPTITRLSELGKAWLEERRDRYVPFFESQFRPLAIASAVRTLREMGLASVERGEGGLRVRRSAPTPAARRPFRCTVLPTFEIWVAEDADPVGTADLGRIADLASTDRVARFTLTQKSVARAAREPGGAAAAIERLAAAAEHGLPDNVRTTLEGWARRATLMRAYRGGVIATASEEQAAFVRGREGVLCEIAPGVFHVESEELTDLLRAAEKVGLMAAPVVRDGRPIGRRETYVDPLPIGKQADDVRAKVVGWAKPEPKKPWTNAKSRPGSPPKIEFSPPPRLEESVPLTVSQFRREWPDVAAAVRDFPPLLEFARRMPLDELDDLLDLDDANAIRSRIARFAMDALPAELPVSPEPSLYPTQASIAAAAVAAVSAKPDVSPSPPSAATPAADDRPWFTPKPGELVQLLAAMALRRETIDIVYMNSAGARTERRIVPLEVLYSGRREWLSAKLVADNSTNRFELDRIVAVRLLRD